MAVESLRRALVVVAYCCRYPDSSGDCDDGYAVPPMTGHPDRSRTSELCHLMSCEITIAVFDYNFRMIAHLKVKLSLCGDCNRKNHETLTRRGRCQIFTNRYVG